MLLLFEKARFVCTWGSWRCLGGEEGRGGGGEVWIKFGWEARLGKAVGARLEMRYRTMAKEAELLDGFDFFKRQRTWASCLPGTR
jgi:hypothetical protein